MKRTLILSLAAPATLKADGAFGGRRERVRPPWSFFMASDDVTNVSGGVGMSCTAFRGPVDRPCLREVTSVYIS
jgi:hypothetical protein